jgi:acetoin utilization deacetylase AcuC-like enzyme
MLNIVFRVLYISLHCADAFPPNEGHPKDSGKDKGLGFNINIGWLNFVNIIFFSKIHLIMKCVQRIHQLLMLIT